MKIDLSDLQTGAEAQLVDIVPFGFFRKIGALAQSSSDDIGAFALGVLHNLAPAWKVKDTTGEDMPAPKDVKGSDLDNMDARIIMRIVEKAQTLIASVAPDPNADGGSSVS